MFHDLMRSCGEGLLPGAADHEAERLDERLGLGFADQGEVRKLVHQNEQAASQDCTNHGTGHSDTCFVQEEETCDPLDQGCRGPGSGKVQQSQVVLVGRVLEDVWSRTLKNREDSVNAKSDSAKVGDEHPGLLRLLERHEITFRKSEATPEEEGEDNPVLGKIADQNASGFHVCFIHLLQELSLRQRRVVGLGVVRGRLMLGRAQAQASADDSSSEEHCAPGQCCESQQAGTLCTNAGDVAVTLRRLPHLDEELIRGTNPEKGGNVREDVHCGCKVDVRPPQAPGDHGNGHPVQAEQKPLDLLQSEAIHDQPQLCMLDRESHEDRHA
mmetsp:Transcript_27795/g.52159  ORF Transcript_27795/g.52159 Transcript_27795/m.52159 type:complete len:327 (+) Transcript_27795:219-1199(+)